MMMRLIQPVERPVNVEVLELAAEVLQRVQSGDTLAIAVVEVHPGGDVSFSTTDTPHYHLLNSGCARLAVAMASDPEP